MQYQIVFLLFIGCLNFSVYLLSLGTECTEFYDNSICRLFRMVDDHFLILNDNKNNSCLGKSTPLDRERSEHE